MTDANQSKSAVGNSRNERNWLDGMTATRSDNEEELLQSVPLKITSDVLAVGLE